MAKKKHHERRRFDSGQHRRILAVTAVLGLLAFLPVALQLYSLMVAQHDRYSALALRNQTRSTAVTAHRGTIYDRNMNVLAASESVQTLYLDPRELKQSKADLQAISQYLSQLLSLDAQWIQEQAKDTTKRYKRIADRLDEQTVSFLRELSEVKESAKSAHKRIDTLEERLNH